MGLLKDINLAFEMHQHAVDALCFHSRALPNGSIMVNGFTNVTSDCDGNDLRRCLQTLEYIEDNLPQETPAAFGLHANAGIGFRMREAEQFTEQLSSLQLQSAAAGGGASVEERAKLVSHLTSIHPGSVVQHM